MIAAGPPPKRPPHMLLLSGESAIRRVPNSKIAILALLLAGSVAGCDREKHRAEQAGAPQANISGGEAARGAPTFQHVIDRSHAGEVAPTAAFRGPDDAPVTRPAFRGNPLPCNLWAHCSAPDAPATHTHEQPATPRAEPRTGT